MEAAAVRGFADVSGPTLELVLLDINAQNGRQKSKRDKVLAVVERFKTSWKWSEVAVAECLVAAQGAKRRQSIKQPDVTGDTDQLAKIMAVLKTDAAAEAEVVVTTEVDHAQAVAEAVVALRVPKPRQRRGGHIGK